MKNLLYITNGINGSGGLERVLSVKASYLAEQYNYQVTILCLNNNHLHPFYEFSDKVKTLSIDVGGTPFQYWKSYKTGIQKAVNEIQPDIISVCDDGLKGFFIPRFLKTKAKIIYERHASIRLNTSQGLKGKVMAKLMQSQVNKFDKFVVLTSSNIKEWPEKNVIAIPNPLSFQTDVKNPLNQKRIIVVGSHSWNKGYDLLISVWQNLETEFPDWRLDVFGKIDANKTFIKMAEELKLKHIHFHPSVKDIQSEYLKSSLLVLPSRSEGFGMVLIEAMECGVPCVAFDCPSGPGDIISNDEDGFLVENQNQIMLAEKLIELMKDENKRLEFGKKAKENVKRYSAEEIVKQWDEVFRELI